MRRRSRELKRAICVFFVIFIVLICLCRISPKNYLCTFFATNSSYHNSHAEGIAVILTFSHHNLTLPILFEVFQWKSWGYLLISYQKTISWMSGYFVPFDNAFFTGSKLVDLWLPSRCEGQSESSLGWWVAWAGSKVVCSPFLPAKYFIHVLTLL